MKNAPLRIKQRIHYVDMFDNESVMSCNTKIASVVNTPKEIYSSTTIMNELTSTYNYDNNNSFEILFQQYTTSSVNIIYCPSLIDECKSNMDKAYYEQNLHGCVYLPSLKRELDRSMN